MDGCFCEITLFVHSDPASLALNHAKDGYQRASRHRCDLPPLVILAAIIMKLLHIAMLLALSSFASSMPIGNNGSSSLDSRGPSNFSPIGNPTPDHEPRAARPENFNNFGNETPDSTSRRAPTNFNNFGNETPDSV